MAYVSKPCICACSLVGWTKDEITAYCGAVLPAASTAYVDPIIADHTLHHLASQRLDLNPPPVKCGTPLKNKQEL